MDRNQIPHDPHHKGVPSVRPKRIMSLWYFWCKPCTYLASRLAVSPNGMKRASAWASSPRSTISWVQNDFWPYDMFGTNHTPILHWHKHYIQMDRNGIPLDPRHEWVPSGASKTISKPMVRLAQTVHLSSTNTNTVSKRTKKESKWPTSPMSSIRCVHNNFWAYGMFGANHAPILR
jgi:hypothetical protein